MNLIEGKGFGVAMRFKMPILRRVDTKDTEGINAAVADGFELIGTPFKTVYHRWHDAGKEQ